MSAASRSTESFPLSSLSSASSSFAPSSSSAAAAAASQRPSYRSSSEASSSSSSSLPYSPVASQTQRYTTTNLFERRVATNNLPVIDGTGASGKHGYESTSHETPGDRDSITRSPETPGESEPVLSPPRTLSGRLQTLLLQTTVHGIPRLHRRHGRK